MDLSELIIEYPNAISDDVCDALIGKFERDEKNQLRGISALGAVDTLKRSTDIHFSGITEDPEWMELDKIVHDMVSPYMHKWTHYLQDCLGQCISEAFVHDTGYQIQKTVTTGGYGWHSDDANTVVSNTLAYPDGSQPWCAWYSRRYATYLLYLNGQDGNFEGGRTQFRVGKDEIYSIVPKKGSMVMFPANGLYPHQGETVTSGVKYLATGWLCDMISTEVYLDHMYTPELIEEYETVFRKRVVQ